MKHSLLQAAAILGMALAAATLSGWTVGLPSPGVDCDPATLKPGEICLESIPADREVLWIDARPREDWERDGLPGSILWNLEASEDGNAMEAEAVMRIFTTPYVVVYCSDKGCGTSRKIADRILALKDLPAEVHVLHGGWMALREAGRVPGP